MHDIISPVIFVYKIIRRLFKIKLFYKLGVKEYNARRIHRPHIGVGNKEVILIGNARILHNGLTPISLIKINDRNVRFFIKHLRSSKINLIHRSCHNYIKAKIVCFHHFRCKGMYLIKFFIKYVNFDIVFFIQLKVSPINR